MHLQLPRPAATHNKLQPTRMHNTSWTNTSWNPPGAHRPAEPARPCRNPLGPCSPAAQAKGACTQRMQETCRACNNLNNTYLHNPVKIVLQALDLGSHLLHSCRRHQAILQLHLHLLHDLQTKSAASKGCLQEFQCCIAILAWCACLRGGAPVNHRPAVMHGSP